MATILAVDDDPDILEALDLLLEDEGYRIILATDGKSAQRSIQRQTPDLVLLDIRLPDINGIDLAKEMKKNKNTQDIPIILFSANYNIKKSDVAHADDFISKPFDIDDLTGRIKRVIKPSNLDKYCIKY